MIVIKGHSKYTLKRFGTSGAMVQMKIVHHKNSSIILSRNQKYAPETALFTIALETLDFINTYYPLTWKKL